MPKRKQPDTELAIITGLSGSGKGTVLKALENIGYYSVDNLPVGLMLKFAELARDSPNTRRAALIVDIREGKELERLPKIVAQVRRRIRTKLVFLEAVDATLMRRFSETRRPHPLGTSKSVSANLRKERRALEPIRALADHIIDTSSFNVHDLRQHVREMFGGGRGAKAIQITVSSFGFRHGVPSDSDLVFDVRFLPNPNYVPALKDHTGLERSVAKFVQGYPQTGEFLDLAGALLGWLIPHYTKEGKTYLTVSFGCTGGRHRSVSIAREMRRRLERAGYQVKETHRDIEKPA